MQKGKTCVSILENVWDLTWQAILERKRHHTGAPFKKAVLIVACSFLSFACKEMGSKLWVAGHKEGSLSFRKQYRSEAGENHPPST